MDMWFPIPEEMRQQMEEAQNRQEMALDSFRHDVQRLFQEIPEEHLKTLRYVLHNLTCANQPRSMASYYEGLVAGILMQRFNVCPSCGTDHDKEAHEFHQDQQPVSESTDPQPQKLLPLQFNEQQIQQMAEFNIDDAYDESTGQILGFICKGCGMMYPTIQDRMLNAPDECTGCIQKAKWG